MEYINEDELLNHHDLMSWIKENKLSKNYFEGGWSWHYQQFLKLLYHKISDTQFYYIIDADVVIKRPFVLISNEGVRTFFITENQGHERSIISTQKLLGDNLHTPSYSFITDSMCFDKYITRDMINNIEKRFNMEFYKAGIIVEQNSKARFSEYEMYGIYANHSSQIYNLKILPAFIPITSIDHLRKRDNLESDNFLYRLKKHPYITYHAWLNN